MKRLAMTLMLVSLLVLGFAHAGQTQVSSGDGAQTVQIRRSGSQSSTKGQAEYFTGSVRVTPLFEAKNPARGSGSSVTFEPGARAAWHTHPLGQTLIVTAGSGLVQQWGGPIQEIKPRDVVWIPPGVKHWHGATPTTAMTHIAIQENLDGRVVNWMEQVSDEQYNAPVRAPGSSDASARSTTSSVQPTPAQRAIGNIAPKLVELTDKVLFGDVWERPELSKRDRSLATVSALIALNRPDQLRSHLALARQNGVTQDELIETITHLAFYAGWPNAVTAISVAKEVFEKK